MRNKPQKLARALRGQSIDDLIAEELDYVLPALVKEFGTTSILSLLLDVVAKYHPDLMERSKGKRGPKEKWSPWLCAMIKVEVDTRRQSLPTLKAVINELNKDPLWKIFINQSEGTFRKKYGGEQDENEIKFARRMRPEDDMWRSFLEAEVKRFEELI